MAWWFRFVLVAHLLGVFLLVAVYEPGVWVAIAVMVAALLLTAAVRMLVHQHPTIASAIEGT